MEMKCCSKLLKDFKAMPLWKKKVNISGTVPMPIFLAIIGLLIVLFCLDLNDCCKNKN